MICEQVFFSAIPRPHDKIISPAICLTSVLYFLYAVCSEEVKICSKVDFAEFLLKGGEHSAFIVDEADEVELIDLATFVASFLAAFTMMILNDYVGVVEEYAYRSAEVLDKIDSSEIEACFLPSKKKKSSKFLDAWFWMGKECLRLNFVQKNGFG